jgi:guanine nucleotide-binding protein G(o) subunit alpha
MGLFASCMGPKTEEQKISQEIDKQIKSQALTTLATKYLLLLGAGECGKSTVVKQMRVIYSDGFSDKDRKEMVKVCRDNAIRSMVAIVNAMPNLGLSFEDDSLDAQAETLRQFLFNFDPESPELPANVVQGVKNLWADSALQEAFGRSKEYQLIDSAKYFIEKIQEISTSSFLPTNDDIIRARQQTQGIVEVMITVRTKNNHSANFKIIDVGGQRSQRKKWIQAFENVTAVIFVAALSDYDLTLAESVNTNRMHESLNLFGSTINMKLFKERNIILFLNKMDLFQQKLNNSALEECFPEYSDGADYEKALDFINLQFRSKNTSQTRRVYVHYTCATDTTALKFLIDTVADTIIQMNLNEVGLQ